MKNEKIGLCHVLSCPKLGVEPKFHDAGTFGGFRKREYTHKPTRFMFISIDCLYLERAVLS